MTVSRLRQYVIASKLGEGGMGVVWKARDTTLERDVALKVLPAEGAASEIRRERFFREARAASALNHPNIITVYEINSDGDTDFIAMELVEGETLSARIGRGPMRLDDVLAIAGQIAEAVSRAHRAGIVHRDLKPGNVMINHDGLVKVLDFGLAKVGAHKTDEERTGEETRLALTREGTALGTMGYMAPEQALGDPADARSDVFSFGIVLYQMLAGALPFEGHTNTEMLRALHFGDPKPLATVRTDVPAWLNAIVAKALAKEPKDRFTDMGEVAAALRGSMVVPSASGPLIQPAPAPAPREYTARRAPPAWSVVAIVSTLAFSAWALVPWGTLRGREEAPGATNAAPTGSPYELTQQAAALLERGYRAANVDRAIAILEAAVARDRGHALAHAYLADAYGRKHEIAPDGQWLKLARETAQRAMELNADLAAAHLALGWVLRAEGQAAESEAAFRRAADLDPLSGVPHLGMAMVAEASGDRDADAERSFRRAIELAPDDWRAHHEFGEFAYERARYADAAAEWEAVRRLTPDNIVPLRTLSAAYFYLGRSDDAASVLQRSLEIEESPATYTNLGTIRFFQGRYTEAVSMFEKAVDLGATRHINWANLGDGLRWAPGRRQDAAAAYRRASALIAEQIAERPDDADLRSRHAMYLVKMGDAGAALEEIAGIVDRPTLTAQQLYRLVIVFELSGDRVQALAALERSLKSGYPATELGNEPELSALRSDARYQRLLSRF